MTDTLFLERKKVVTNRTIFVKVKEKVIADTSVFTDYCESEKIEIACKEGCSNYGNKWSCEQIVEKYMKGVLEQQNSIAPFELAKLLKSHNLRILGMKINSVLEIKLSLPDLVFLGDFYFDARYPGDNFVTVTPEISAQCREIMENVLITLQPFVKSTGTSEMKSF